MAIVDFPTVVVVDRPVIEVFRYMCDVARFPEWMPFAQKATLTSPVSPGEDHVNGFGRGARYLLQYGFNGVPTMLLPGRVLDFSLGRMISMRADVLEMSATYTLEPGPAGTVLRARHQTWGFGMSDWLTPFANDMASRALWTIKQRVELSDAQAADPAVFFSYRRAEMQYVGGRIFAILEQEFGPGRVFRDIDSIDAGARVENKIERVIDDCPITLAVIGPGWLTEVKRRQDAYEKHRSADWVHAELARALENGGEVIPLLVGGELPTIDDGLPDDLHRLVGRNALAIRPDPDFASDTEVLIRTLRGILRERGRYS